MKHTKLILAVSLVIATLSLPLFLVHAAGGTITGKISDPKDAAINGATVTATNTATKQEFKGSTDRQGKYKLEGLPAGVYEVRISAKGLLNLDSRASKLETTRQ